MILIYHRGVLSDRWDVVWFSCWSGMVCRVDCFIDLLPCLDPSMLY